jgi:hypothetical protein
MKFRILIVVILIAVAAYAGQQWNRPRTASDEATSRQEIHKKISLLMSARVEVRGINGSIQVRTADVEQAEVNVVVTARNGRDIKSRKVLVDYSPEHLMIRGEQGSDGLMAWFRGHGEVRQDVSLVLPRSVYFSARDVNGAVIISEAEGLSEIEVRGVNGRVEVAGAAEQFSVSDINGGVKLTPAQLGEAGMDVRGINGNIEVRLPVGLSADVAVRDKNGNVTFDLPNLTSQSRADRSNVSARIGTGGPTISFRDINGNIRFASSGQQATSNGVPPPAPHIEPVAPIAPVAPSAPVAPAAPAQ